MEAPPWMFIFSVLMSITAVFTCTFPKEWHGTWYQNIFGELSISETEISRKGVCIENVGNKYIVSNREQECYRCLVINPWHQNVIQYKEMPGSPVTCPFQGRYSFSYTYNGKGSCSTPQSEIHACADESKFKFLYKECPGIPDTKEREVYFQCLATWENGEKYLYGRFSGSDISDRVEMYRCFMHSLFGYGGDMSMSADASCQGLQSPTVGTSTMTLDRYPTPVMQCRFPSIFDFKKVWRDLSGRTQLVVDDQMQVMRIKDTYPSFSLNADESGSHQVKLVMRCRTSHSGIGGVQKFVVHTTTSECESNYRCVQIKQRDVDGKVLEMELGQPLNDEFTACDDRTFTTGEKRILIADDVKPRNCPVQGVGSFGFTDKTSDCTGEFIIGCSLPQEIVIKKKCPINLQSVKIWRCLSDWEEGNAHYVIVQSPKLFKPAKCLSFTVTDNGIEVQEDEFCMRRTTVSRSSINYLLFQPRAHCNPNTHSSITESPSGMTSDRSKTFPNRTGTNSIQGSKGVIDAENSSRRLFMSSVILFLSLVTIYFLIR
ncbi:uncharacterized protein LOC125671006 isoform X2 [Ostrea edulis]|uniref:uncharacterized protein LOC125671006 isoform X2 n=1 Tax=Ostrea edulis TaxID=37623 RepID=UPI0024AEA826|nr:uncharacterized protein LOC125671006 isoform X2 [Ostrea edulis]